MTAITVDLEQQLEAEDGVIDVDRVMPHLDFPWASLPPGPRRWAPTDLSVEVEEDTLSAVRLTYRTVGDRAVVVAGARPDVDVDWMAERMATPLLFAQLRKTNAGVAPASLMAALETEMQWDEPTDDGWTFGRCGVGSRPVRLAHRSSEEGHVIVAASGVAIEELTTLVGSLVDLTDDPEAADELHVRHRRALAQRWWDAPRTPWTPDN